MNKKCFKTRLLLQKRYFDLGWSITGYLKYILALFGIASLNVKATMVLAVCYAVFCYVFGWAWVKFGWYTIDIEITNMYNLFVKEMRSKLKSKTFK